jgi:hypothetical protein
MEFRLRHHDDALEADAHRGLAGTALERQGGHHHFLGGSEVEDCVRRSLGIEERGTGRIHHGQRAVVEGIDQGQQQYVTLPVEAHGEHVPPPRPQSRPPVGECNS